MGAFSITQPVRCGVTQEHNFSSRRASVSKRSQTTPLPCIATCARKRRLGVICGRNRHERGLWGFHGRFRNWELGLLALLRICGLHELCGSRKSGYLWSCRMHVDDSGPKLIGGLTSTTCGIYIRESASK